MDEWELEAGQNDDYEYGYDYLFEEREIRPADAAEGAGEPDGPDGEEQWWQEDEEAQLEALRAEYREAGQVDEAASWREDEFLEASEASELSFAKILAEMKAEEREKQETEAQKAKKRLVRDMKAEALHRMESAARSPSEFRAVQAVWDFMDESRERKRRLHELPLADEALDAISNYRNPAVVPLWFNHPTVRQLQRGNFLDYFADCPYEMHDLTGKEYLRRIVLGMKEDHKELLYFLYLRLLSPQRVAVLRGQTDRNVRKVRDVALRKLRKKVYLALAAQAEKGRRSFTKQEREFLETSGEKEGANDAEHL